MNSMERRLAAEAAVIGAVRAYFPGAGSAGVRNGQLEPIVLDVDGHRMSVSADAMEGARQVTAPLIGDWATAVAADVGHGVTADEVARNAWVTAPDWRWDDD
ncbi:hypothetical protein [Frankia sp. Cj3]|uniref:hypothetical protein n=1 Tax=Frankia sp. Cj3 TaxID=2880976 RepID=UPI001EF47C4F|nr:hypothetical protein [Frankia sp. Cj3]